jgi:hypothetical protein
LVFLYEMGYFTYMEGVNLSVSYENERVLWLI